MPQSPPPSGPTAGGEMPAGEAPAAALLRMMRGYWVAQAIFVAARLGLADLLRDGPQSCAALAERTEVPAASLHRLLRALASVGVFAEVSDQTFALSPLAEPLRSDVSGSLHASAVVAGELLYPSWNELLPALRTGQAQFERAFGADFWDYLAARPALAARFQEMMADQNVRTGAAVPAVYDFRDCQHIVDVAGGAGSQLIAILRAYPHLRGTLVDLPYVLEQARQELSAHGVADRCTLVAGDFFTSVPAAGDVYLLRWILHDFDDERATRILRTCRTAMLPGSRLLIIEQVIATDSPSASWMAKFQDLQMLMNLGGRERTAPEFRALVQAAGFTLQRIIPTQAPSSILECQPR